MSPPPITSQQRESWQHQIDLCCEQLTTLRTLPGLASRCLGHEAADLQLWSLGLHWLQQNSATLEVSPPDGPDVYIATQLFADGGHTALIGDFVRALDHPSRPSPHLVLTNLFRETIWPLTPDITSRIPIPTKNLHQLDGATIVDRMEQLFHLLLHLRPRRLFLFHHPNDPLPCLVSHVGIAPQRVLVHHADATPCFGLHLPGIQIIDLNPSAAAFTRIQGLHPQLLPLTCPDPGPRPSGFLHRGHLVTASCGSLAKFRTPYHLRYHETVAFLLQQTQGWHVHIGALEPSDLHEIHTHLNKRNISPDRLIHVPWTPSLTQCLWEHRVDVYFASFPINGARVNAEVAASATPHLTHHRHGPFPLPLSPSSSASPTELTLDGSLRWITWEHLSNHLSALADGAALQEKSHQIRSSYERAYHPAVFQRTLLTILNQQEGWQDPQAERNDQVILQAMLKSLIQAASHLQSQNHQQQTELQQLGQRDLVHQRRIDFLQHQRKKLRSDLRHLRQKINKSLRTPTQARSIRARLKHLFFRLFS